MGMYMFLQWLWRSCYLQFSLVFARAGGPGNECVFFILVVNVLSLYLEDGIRVIILIQCM